MLGACSTCVRLQFRVTSCGTTVNIWMIFSFIHLFFFSLFILSAVFISVWVGLSLICHWSEKKISYFGVVYKYLSVGMAVVVIKEFFIILYIFLFIIYLPSIYVFVINVG